MKVELEKNLEGRGRGLTKLFPSRYKGLKTNNNKPTGQSVSLPGLCVIH